MTRLLIVLVLALSACDSARDAVEEQIAFDYVPGAVPILDGEALLPASASAATMQLTPTGRDRDGNRYVRQGERMLNRSA